MSVLRGDGTDTEGLLALIWGATTGPEPPVFALLDAARDDRIRSSLAANGLSRTCLLPGPLTTEMAAAAPHLVRLRRSAPLTRELLESGWGRSWGIYIVATAGTDEPQLATRLRQRLLVPSPEGRTLYFRYYDPRVLRWFLSVATPSEAATLLGGLAVVFESSESPSAVPRRMALPGSPPGTLRLRREMLVARKS